MGMKASATQLTVVHVPGDMDPLIFNSPVLFTVSSAWIKSYIHFGDLSFHLTEDSLEDASTPGSSDITGPQ